MGKKVFVSYKYKDLLVKDLNKTKLAIINGELRRIYRPTRVRDYVDEFQNLIGKEHINLGEKDGESLKDFSDGQIASALKEKIYGSSVTVVMMSKGMKDPKLLEEEQWIPWEVSYSLRLVTRDDKTSQMNALLGVVLPDENGSYGWYYTINSECNCITHHTNKLFRILKANMFNIRDKEVRECKGVVIHINPEPSFMKTVKWDDFIYGENYNYYIEKAVEIKESKDLYITRVKVD